MTDTPATQAGTISEGMRARMQFHRAWFEAHPNQPMPEGREEVEKLIAAIEREASASATALLRNLALALSVVEIHGRTGANLERLADALDAANKYLYGLAAQPAAGSAEP